MKEKADPKVKISVPLRNILVKYDNHLKKIEYASSDELKQGLKKKFALYDFDSVEFLLDG